MANIQVYFGIEILSMTNGQRNALVASLQGLGANNGSFQPAERNHWRIRLDNNAAIFEGLFDEDSLTIASIKSYLATTFNVAVGTISHSTSSNVYGFVITFTHSAVQRLRMIAFGHSGSAWPSWAVSRDAAAAYLAANIGEWEAA